MSRRRHGSRLRPPALPALLAAAWLLSAGAMAWPASAWARILAAPGGGQVRGLILGIDAYRKVTPLHGAVADARDIELTLRKLGAQDLSVLIDGDATRKATFAAFDALLARTKPGDLVVLTLAGHGSREPERKKGSKPDGYDEVYLLTGFDVVAPGSGERIFGDEFRDMVSKLEAKGADVIYLADACHGEGLIRSWDPRAVPPSYRQTRYVITEDALAPLDLPTAPADAPTFKRVTFLAAVDALSKSPEVPVPGISGLRGALSYAFARALEGQASPSGRTNRRDLFTYLRQEIYQLSDQRQNPVLRAPEAPEGVEKVLFVTQPDVPVVPGASASAPVEQIKPGARTSDATASVKIAVLNAKAGAADLLPRTGRVPLVVAAPEAADLVFDAASGDALVAGDIIRRGAVWADLPGIAERILAVKSLKALSAEAAQSVTLTPDDRTHHEAERVAVHVDGLQGRNLLLFNIASDGTVQALWPDPARQETARVDKPSFDLALKVAAPFGADLLVAVTSPTPTPDLDAAIHARDGVKAALDLPGLVAKAKASAPGLRLGFTALYTAPEGQK
jgi:hypothetical protein